MTKSNTETTHPAMTIGQASAEVCRFTAMCVPGDRDDGSDAGWHVYDRLSRISKKVGTGAAAEALAITAAREANRRVGVPRGLQPRVA
jgi:hypothetical protein